jgi:uncharacterized protein YndB with AHSA1/START domain
VEKEKYQTIQKIKQMSEQPFMIERVFDVPITTLWDALTKNEQMKKWYFNMADFKPVIGFEFQFTGTTEENTEYLHLCRVTEVIPAKKLAYSWRYDGYPGISIVTFELTVEGGKTRLKLTHAGLESFASAGRDFAKENFAMGWTSILDKSLKGFVESDPVKE